jgi:DNA-binding transcriptional LysR family regulator
MRRIVPPLEAAEAFLAAANAPSFRAAAALLALSPSAFSRRVQQLERFVGVELVNRANGPNHLTAEGHLYLAELGPAIETIRAATLALRARHGDHRMRIATSHSLASEWLLPRLPVLLAEHGIEVELEISRDPQLLRDRAVDLGIWGCHGFEPGIVSETIAPMQAAPVCAAKFADGRQPPRAIDDLSDYRLLTDRTSRWIWPRWLETAGYRGTRPRVIDHFETNQLCNEAAASGLGISLCLPLVAERFIEARRLIACIPTRLQTGAAYCVHWPEGTAPVGAARTVLEWVKREAERSLDRFDKWWSGAAQGLVQQGRP